MRETCTSGSVGAAGEQSPAATRPHCSLAELPLIGPSLPSGMGHPAIVQALPTSRRVAHDGVATRSCKATRQELLRPTRDPVGDASRDSW